MFIDGIEISSLEQLEEIILNLSEESKIHLRKIFQEINGNT